MNLLRSLTIFTILLTNLALSKPGFCQANVEYHILSKNGSIEGALIISFPEGWNTYWKFPGPNGFVPRIKVLNEMNLDSFSISWPYPKKLGPDNFTYLGYDGDLFLTLELDKLDEQKNMYLHLDLSFGICKNVCVVQNKTIKIDDKSDINYLVLEKILKSKNKITMETSFRSPNKCTIKKMTDKEYKITIENDFMKKNELLGSILIDYKGSSWIIEKQSFYPEVGKVEALFKSENISLNDLKIENLSLIYMDGKIAKRTIGCPS